MKLKPACRRPWRASLAAVPPREHCWWAHLWHLRRPVQFDSIEDTRGYELDSVDFTGEGCVSRRGSLGSIAAQVGAIDVQIVDWGDT